MIVSSPNQGSIHHAGSRVSGLAGHSHAIHM